MKNCYNEELENIGGKSNSQSALNNNYIPKEYKQKTKQKNKQKRKQNVNGNV